MSSNPPVAEMVAHLQKKIAYHKEQLEAHAKQEALHGEKRALHEAEHRKAVERCEALQAASAAAGELLKDVKPSAPRSAPARKEVKSGGWHWIADLLERAIETKAPGEAFGATSLIDEILERWGSKLRNGIDVRSAQTTLRRWAQDGLLEVVRKGRSRHEALYTKPRE
jgi:fumarylacetoacetate (FAA) hydrolase family protein